MRTLTNCLGITAVVSAALLVGACGGGGGAGMEDDSPEGRAYMYRHAVMELVAANNAVLGGMARGEIPDDQARFTKAATNLAALATMLPDGFEQEGIAAGSRALPEIWTNMSDFEQKAADFENAAQSVAAAATGGNFAQAKELAGGIGQTCGGCHRPYRAPAD
jgi:cytochrome c556